MDTETRPPEWFQSLYRQRGDFMSAVENLGRTIRQAGPLDDRTTHLIQLAAAASVRSEGSVHSHARRALAAGATPEELYHSLMVLTSTIGFPTVSAALSWVDDVIGDGSTGTP